MLFAFAYPSGVPEFSHGFSGVRVQNVVILHVLAFVVPVVMFPMIATKTKNVVRFIFTPICFMMDAYYFVFVYVYWCSARFP